jgi:hypothetical protein
MSEALPWTKLVNKMYLITAVVIACVVAGIVGWIMLGPANPFGLLAGQLARAPADTLGKDFLSDLSTGNVDVAYRKRTTETFRQHLPLDEFRAMVQAYPELRDSQASAFTILHEEKGLITFKGSVEGPRGSLIVVLDVTTKDGTGWKVDRFTVWKATKREVIVIPDQRAAR